MPAARVPLGGGSDSVTDAKRKTLARAMKREGDAARETVRRMDRHTATAAGLGRLRRALTTPCSGTAFETKRPEHQARVASWVGRVGGGIVGPRYEGSGRQSPRIFGMSARMARMLSSVSSPLKPRATLTFWPDHITTVTSASFDNS